LENLLIDLLLDFGLRGVRIDGKTGVWIQDRKISSIGHGVRKWVTMHGFALNVANDLSGFQNITPCGLSDIRMTSISGELETEISLQTVRENLIPHLSRSFKDFPKKSGRG
jgi:lipoyl(octanoyl) transferase